jgi:hypothetical protein
MKHLILHNKLHSVPLLQECIILKPTAYSATRGNPASLSILKNVAVISKDLTVTGPGKETALLSHSLILFVQASTSPTVLSHGWFSK